MTKIRLRLLVSSCRNLISHRMFSTQPTPPSSPHCSPPSYLSFTFELPRRRYVGMLACQRTVPGTSRSSTLLTAPTPTGDPLLHQLTTRVVSCSKRALAAPAPASKGKKSKAVVEEAQPDEWEIELEDTGDLDAAGDRPRASLLTSVSAQCSSPRVEDSHLTLVLYFNFKMELSLNTRRPSSFARCFGEGSMRSTTPLSRSRSALRFSSSWTSSEGRILWLSIQGST